MQARLSNVIIRIPFAGPTRLLASTAYRLHSVTLDMAALTRLTAEDHGGVVDAGEQRLNGMA